MVVGRGAMGKDGDGVVGAKNHGYGGLRLRDLDWRDVT